MAYYISPRFLDKIAIHLTKNFLELPGVQVPLILGIHGRKGEGKTFQCELDWRSACWGSNPFACLQGSWKAPMLVIQPG
jgi:hypothetical protein